MVALEQLYEKEYDRWLSETIELLKNRQFDRVDYEHLIEELAAWGRREKTAVKSLSLQIIIYLLLYQFWTTERTRNINHWAAEMITFRVQLEDKLTTDLSKFLEVELENIYENARLIAEKKTGLKNLPIICPYSLRQILEKQWFPDTDNQ
ncbi:MAG: DUF29 domain-containing protein [Microcystis panniformis Mp_MB_F_20051200_S9]|uniref:DUF29 domain-containing protein n=1 Tax=Microcystis panniformis Mp_MB_F_20051200_S9 TaxID=2486223 RepID=A0A552PQV3_9CHRO|nr:MAG: DUF29 domain-containing protein [Microcystis panniformis Mp_GB_SS_20050300_S99D]TRV52531.1 MAG: DUF29 domain-containing protein [Microcystis panniformis Mp_GB_SS_20050300_S99]TRV52791.1 MAG: DUF29 domain-containing protein [Microcystis panniformis Mp_MB_F_20080800_S26D]TRV55713.1 MAG: DUF29 domain-containing protein [Microcystis panniformis Mp_MB_F_20080800_S26]TRV59374.1 MAG: DUF29 domain-containing protein [Microcystis panniformis Mp_MB_F_20051200_S9]TRV66256.1 MAG: DUF29 domain-cont